MAALDGKITIGIDYRPCIVHIPAVMRNRRQDLNVYREVVEPEKDVKALFHCWSHRSEVVGESYLRGWHPAGQISYTFAIVEFEDGTVHEIEPCNIRFIDNLTTEYSFEEKKIMSLDKSISSGKERRKQYTGAKAADSTCRNHGSCSWCQGNRTHKNEKRKLAATQRLEDFKESSCKWRDDFTWICFNGDSEMCADVVDDDYCRECRLFKEGKYEY